MAVINSKEIRDKFLAFFQSKDHLLIQNASIIPKNDPTLLFVNSGMAPIKNFFTGEEKPAYPRLCNIQPCIRTIDIDEIGDKHHLTSFQMLGSWSINNYFKEKAIPLAFEFLTKCLNIPREKLYATVFAGDESIGLQGDLAAREHWEKAGMIKEHIVACGKEDNFWGPTSDTGPCGPCTEVFYDTGKGKEYIPGGEFDTKQRYIEIWNAGVFMQLNKNADGTYGKLSFTSVDTGAGLERLAMVLNGYESVYDTDVLYPIKSYIEGSIGKQGILDERSLRILTDHLRTISLILSENVKPSNEGRGYIPRKLIRKCIMIIKKHKINNFDFESVLKFVINKYSELYPDFMRKQEIIIDEFNKEKVQFEKVLENGFHMLEGIRGRSQTISGEEVFELVTTYGIPYDIVVDYAKESDIEIDERGFKEKLQKHKEVSRNSSKNSEKGLSLDLERFKDYPKTEFLGYDLSNLDAKILCVVVNGKQTTSASVGDKVSIVLDRTCMYAESGGQVSDRGFIIGENFKIKVDDVKKNKSGVFVHFGVIELTNGTINGKVSVEIDKLRREGLASNHSSVHLLQSALRNIFGKDVHQAGSKVEEHSLRFDFNYDASIEENRICEIENLVNSYIRDNLKQVTEVKSLSEAIKEGAIALFESKYTDDVRVVSFGGVSKELCGGTHTSMTGNIGLFCITAVESIGKGIKRIIAVTGQDAMHYIQKNRAVLKNVCSLLKVDINHVEEKTKSIMSNSSKKGGKTNNKFNIESVNLIDLKRGIKGGYIVKDEYDKAFNELSINMADKIEGVLLCISGVDKKRLLIAVSDKLTAKIKANELMKELIGVVGGKGGGNGKIASGGTNAQSEEIIKAFTDLY